MKGKVLDTIHDDLIRTLWNVGNVGKVGKDAVTYLTVTKYAHSAQFPGRKEATPSEAPDVECSPVDEAIPRLLPNFRFRFRLCMSFRGRSVFRDPSCTSTGTDIGTSRNHFASRCDSFDGSPL
jgi:hypothetical protein